MKKIKLVFSVLIVSVFLFSTSYADSSSSCKSSSQQMKLEKFNRNPHVGISFMYDSFVNSFFPEVTFLWSWFEAGVGANYEHKKNKNNYEWNETNLGFHAGFRFTLIERLCHSSKLSGSIGYVARFGFLGGDYDKAKLTKRPYGMGPYLGLNYGVTKRLEVFARISPYAYNRSASDTRDNSVFREGQVGLNWYFF